MKNKGFMFMELLIIMGIFAGIIFPMIMLMNKNIKNVIEIRKDYEVKRVSKNLENIFINLSKRENITGNYILELDKEKENFIFLKNISGREITKIGGFKYIPYGKADIFRKNIYFQENGKEEKLGEVFILELFINDKKIKKVLKTDEY